MKAELGSLSLVLRAPVPCFSTLQFMLLLTRLKSPPCAFLFLLGLAPETSHPGTLIKNRIDFSVTNTKPGASSTAFGSVWGSERLTRGTRQARGPSHSAS